MSLTDAGVILLGLLLGLHYWLLLRLLGLLGRILGRLDALEQRAADSQAGQQAGSAVEPRAGSSAAATVSPAGR